MAGFRRHGFLDWIQSPTFAFDHMSAEQKRGYILTDNKLAQNGLRQRIAMTGARGCIPIATEACNDLDDDCDGTSMTGCGNATIPTLVSMSPTKGHSFAIGHQRR
jgi:hypothetical protein